MLQTNEQIVTKTCPRHGDYEARSMALMGREIITECPQCIQDQRSAEIAQRAAAERHAMEQRLERLLGRALIPKRFASLGFDSYHPDNDRAARVKAACVRYAERFEERLAMGGGLTLCGNTGTGKTHLACAIANHVMREHGRTALFTSITRMSARIKSSYSPGAPMTEEQAITVFVEPDLLIIDELGAQRGTETELLLAQEVINERYLDVRPTILISNLSEQELAQFVGDRAMNRMLEGKGAVLAFDWESHRRSVSREYATERPALPVRKPGDDGKPQK